MWMPHSSDGKGHIYSIAASSHVEELLLQESSAVSLLLESHRRGSMLHYASAVVLTKRVNAPYCTKKKV